MRRREFIAGLGGAAVWPLAARAQQGGRLRIGVLLSLAADDPESQVRLAAFLQGLQELGWTVGRNVQIDFRWSTDDASRKRYSAELVALRPDVILAQSGVVAGALQQMTRTVPIVFVGAIDPVGAGLVASLARPGGNATGFASYEFSLAAKWLELLKDIAPSVTRVAILRDPAVPAGSAPFGAIQTRASSLRVEGIPIDTRDADELERAVTALHKSQMVD
jgi:putative tryptophan/tyrosine transport system substrate-binding protein